MISSGVKCEYSLFSLMTTGILYRARPSVIMAANLLYYSLHTTLHVESLTMNMKGDVLASDTHASGRRMLNNV